MSSAFGPSIVLILWEHSLNLVLQQFVGGGIDWNTSSKLGAPAV